MGAMKLKRLMALSLCLLVGGVATWDGGSSAQAASTTWQWVKTKKYPDVAYHLKDATKSATMWDLKHNKKIHNLKNYPKTTWYLSQSVKLQMGKKSGIYYLVKNNTNKVAGLVYRDYLKKGVNPDDKLANDPAVKAYGGNLAGIKSFREEKTLQVDILALFPGTILNDALSADAKTDLNAAPELGRKYSATNKNAKAIGIFSPYNWIKTTAKTDYSKLVADALTAQGYTAAKRRNYKGYQIGIYATPHGYVTGYKNWVSGYGSWGIYLVPTAD
ncbi:hypothetical protein FC96_GL000846 [Secundilactobacillus kimchicus JCM 15530]|uniref:D-alanyl-D-alanine carboxypeptidase n=2 Tax=Secundilactobacillus kimchicus TaxID=528209 RepID=A0A0R1HKQ0_9LACO|nr:hypothetical protein FC96_GL000846 [Secundilactobacillus kimchicus JCM 15530]